eukprot:667658-Amorphochlora_amoeboformis.AAC.1
MGTATAWYFNYMVQIYCVTYFEWVPRVDCLTWHDVTLCYAPLLPGIAKYHPVLPYETISMNIHNLRRSPTIYN